MPFSTSRLIAHSALGAAMAIAILPAAAPPALGATGLLPDLQMAAPYNIQVQTGTNGRRLLRFGTMAWNVGDGPLEIRTRDRDGTRMMRVFQIVHTGGRVLWQRVPEASAFYSGDGHNHWHIGRFIDVTLTPQADATTPTDQRRLRKIGFCLVDVVRAPAALRPPNSVAKRGYWVDGCGKRSSTRLRVGISVGWGDDYRPFFTHQQINVTNLPAGVYRLCATVNPQGLWREKGANASNNSYWYDLNLDAAAATVSPVAHGGGPCEAPPPPAP